MSVRPLALMVACMDLGGAATAQPASPTTPAKATLTVSGDVDVYLYVVEEEGPLFNAGGLGRSRSPPSRGPIPVRGPPDGVALGGWTFEAGIDVHLAVVPMVAAVVGQTAGVAAGCELTISWKAIELYSESDTCSTPRVPTGISDTPGPSSPCGCGTGRCLGLSVQRTREHRGARWIDRGVFGAVSKEPVGLSFHWFNVEAGSRFAILGISLGF